MSGGAGEREAGVGAWRQARSAVIAHYEATLRQHGPTSEGMNWKDAASQRLRFRVLCEVCDLEGLTLHEIGAGAGHLRDFLHEQGCSVQYSGSDVAPGMVAAARRAHPGVSFEERDILLEPPGARYDVVVCSGVFHVKGSEPEDAWRCYVQEALRRIYGICRVAIAFNLLSDRVDWREPRLYYADPALLLEFCRAELSPFVVLRHDYPLYEYSVYVYREPRG